MEVTGTIFNIMRFAVNDGPGIRTTVFFKGCPLHCQWCHNPESISTSLQTVIRTDRCIRCGRCAEICPSHAVEPDGSGYRLIRERCEQCGTCVDVCPADAREIIGRTISLDDLMRDVLRDTAFYDRTGGGVTFSGGEPLLQHEFLTAALTRCKAHGLRTAVDTTGFTAEDVLLSIAPVTDLFLYDVKSMDDAIHRAFTGVGNARILANLRALADRGARIIIRVPVIPGVNDSSGNLRATAELAATLPSVEALHLLPFHAAAVSKYERLGDNGGMHDVVPHAPGHLEALASGIRRVYPHVLIGGYDNDRSRPPSP